MKRIQYHRYGGPAEMRLESCELPALKPDQVLIRIRAASVNPVDWKVRNGMLKLITGRSFPKGMGIDFSGVVERLGASVTRLHPGDEVLGMLPLTAPGTFAEGLVTSEKSVVLKPAATSFEQAACLPVAGVTAWYGLVHKAKVKPGQFVFVNGCSGAVGEAAVQVAKHLGASVAGSCGPASLEAARRLGVHPVIDYTKQTLSDLEQKFDLVFDTAGTLSIKAGLAASTAKGVLLDINGSPGKFVRGLFSRRYKSFFGSQETDALQSVVDLVQQGKLELTMGSTAPLYQAIQLISDAESGRKARGKSVVTMSES